MTNHFVTSISRLICLLMLFHQSTAFSYTTDRGLIKINSEAAQGDCLPEFNRDVNSVLRQNGIEVYTARNRPNVRNGSGCQELDALPNRTPLTNPQDPRLRSLARVVALYSSLGTGLMTAHQNIKVVFGTVDGPSRQCDDHIQLNGGEQNCLGLGTTLESDPHGGTSNIALIAHEIGHQIANANEAAIFKQYISSVPSKCNITTYARRGRRKSPRSEEFAEVLAAYVTNPSMFIGKGRHCRKAFSFFAELFGETPENGQTINMSCESRRASSGTSPLLQQVPILPSPGPLRFAPRYYEERNEPEDPRGDLRYHLSEGVN